MLAAGIRPGYLAWFWGLIHPESQPRIDTGSGPTYFFQLAKFGSMLGQIIFDNGLVTAVLAAGIRTVYLPRFWAVIHPKSQASRCAVWVDAGPSYFWWQPSDSSFGSRDQARLFGCHSGTSGMSFIPSLSQVGQLGVAQRISFSVPSLGRCWANSFLITAQWWQCQQLNLWQFFGLILGRHSPKSQQYNSFSSLSERAVCITVKWWK